MVRMRTTDGILTHIKACLSFNSEFGGTWWNPKAAAEEASWGYGQRPKNVEEFYTRFEKLCGVLLDHPSMFGLLPTRS